MKKILLIPDFSEFGGTRTYFIQLIDFYKKYNYDVTIALKPSQVLLLNDIKIAPFKIVTLPNYHLDLTKVITKRFPFSIFIDLLAIAKIYIQARPDIVVTSLGNPGDWLGLFILPSRLLYILHTYPFYPNGILPRMAFLRKAFISFFLNDKKRIITVSKFSKNEIGKYLTFKNKTSFIHVIHNSAGKILSSSLSKKKPNQKILILTLGHVVWYKDPETWLKVAENVLTLLKTTNVEFVWVGNGDEYEKIFKKIMDSKFSNNIKLIAFQKDLPSLISSADIYFQPSLIESHGLAVLEAMRLGIPSVVTNAGGLPESVENGSNGYVAGVKDIDLLSQYLIKLAESPSLREGMGAQCLETYSRLFSSEVWENYFSKYH